MCERIGECVMYVRVYACVSECMYKCVRPYMRCTKDVKRLLCVCMCPYALVSAE